MRTWTINTDLGCRTDCVREIKELCSNYKEILSLVVLFGSTARNEYSYSSDIDLYIESDSLTSSKLVKSKEYDSFISKIYNILGYNTDIDLLSFGRNEIKSVRESILFSQVDKDGIILYDKRTEDV